MSFFQRNKKETIEKKTNRKATFLQTYLNHKHHKLLFKKQIFFVKRMSLFISRKKASITVEASLIVPMFLFLIMNLISMLDTIRLFSNVEIGLHQTAKQMAIYGYAYDQIETNSEIAKRMGATPINFLYAKGNVVKILGENYLDKAPIVNGKNGISLLQSHFLEDDMIDLVAEYHVKPVFSMFGYSKVSFINRARMRMWTGYDNAKGNEDAVNADEIVYITENGTVYHKDQNCTHLMLSIQSVKSNELGNRRNTNGGKYYPCEICCKNHVLPETVFITDEGDRYHISKECSGLKRTVFAISIKNIGNRTPCKRCGDME